MLDYAGYANSQNINLNVEKEELKTLNEEELANKIVELTHKIPGLRDALQNKPSEDEKINDTHALQAEEDENVVKH